MPYIPKNERKRYDHLIEEITTSLLEKLPADNGKDFSEGDLNYVVSKIVWGLFDAAPSYRRANKLAGALTCIQQELFRRRINNYEDKKIAENGDL